MQETLTFPIQGEGGSPPRFTFPELHNNKDHQHSSNNNNNMSNSCCSELSSTTSTPFVSAPSSPSRMKGFVFSAPASPSWAQRTLEAQDQDPQNFPFWYQKSWDMEGSSSSSSPKRKNLSSEHDKAPNLAQAEHHSTSPLSLHTQPYRSSTWALQSLQTEHPSSSPLSPKSLHTQPDRSSNWALQSLHTEHHSISPSSPKSLHTEPNRSSNWAGKSPPHSTPPWSQKSLHTEPNRDSNWAQNPLQAEHDSSSTWYQKALPPPIITNHKVSERAQVEDVDASYSRKSFYASAVPFSWEEKPGTPKARSVTSETSNGEDVDPASILRSGSSEFEFSARFSELEESPMSPTPISSTFNSFKHHSAYSSPSPTYNLAHANSHMEKGAANEGQIWPLRPPPRLDNPVLPMKQLIRDEANEHKGSYGSLSSLSAPQSPRSPRIFHIRGVFCGMSSASNTVFDPFLAAMEKTMAKNNDDSATEKSVGKNTASRSSHGHHRRTQSFSPLRVFHWDDHSAKSNSSSNGSLCMDEVKNKHPIHREINARHSSATPKGSKKWSLRGFLHRKSISGSSGSGGESARHSNTSASLRSSGRKSCGSPPGAAMGEVLMDAGYVDEHMKVRSANSPTNNTSSMLSSIPSSPSSILSSSSSGNSSRGKLNSHSHKANKAPYALHYGMQRAQAEELRKKTFLPYKQGLLGCLGLSSKSYRALATFSKPLQSVS